MIKSEFKLSDLEQGEQRGFRWFKINRQNDKITLVVFAPDSEIPETVTLGNYQFRSDSGFWPFDETIEKPNSVIYSELSYYEMDLKEFITQHVNFPENCEINCDYGARKDSIHFTARTWRDGRVKTIRKKTNSTSGDVVEQIKKIFKYFEKNCPKPNHDQNTSITASPVGQAIIDSLKYESLESFKTWHGNIVEMQSSDHIGRWIADLTVDGMLMQAEGIENVTFKKPHDLGQALVEIKMIGGHVYKEDKDGASVILALEPNKTLLVGSRGNALSTILGIPGAEEMEIRSANLKKIKIDRDKFEERMHFRSNVNCQEIKIPERQKDSDEDVIADIRTMFGSNGGIFYSCQDAVIPMLQSLDPRSLRELLSGLKVGHHVNLEEYGLSRTVIKAEGGCIKISYSIPRQVDSDMFV